MRTRPLRAAHTGLGHGRRACSSSLDVHGRRLAPTSVSSSWTSDGDRFTGPLPVAEAGALRLLALRHDIEETKNQCSKVGGAKAD